MGLRYEDVTDDVMDMLKEIRASYFPELRNAKIKVLFDLKKRQSGGMLVLGRIMKTNDLLRHLTVDQMEAVEGYDYIIALDKLCWQSITDEDRARIIRHELRHTYFDIDADNSPYKLQNHTIADFYEEVENNKADPRWRDRVGRLVADIYEQQKEERKGKKHKGNGRGSSGTE